MKYTSLFDYLDEHLPDHPTKEQILVCKGAYYKRYRRQHRKQRVKDAKALSLTISKELWQELVSRSEEIGLNTYDYIKTLLCSTQTHLMNEYQFSTELYLSFECLKQYIDGDGSIDEVYQSMKQLILKL